MVEANLIHSAVPSMIHTNDGLRFDGNLYWYTGAREPRWSYGGREHAGFAAYRRNSGQDASGLFADPKLTATMRLRAGSPAIDGKGPDIGALEYEPASGDTPGTRSDLYPGSWALVSQLGGDDDSRAQTVFLQSALEQYGERGLVVAAGFPAGASPQLRHDLNLGRLRTFTSAPTRAERFPTTLLVAPDGSVVRRWVRRTDLLHA